MKHYSMELFIRISWLIMLAMPALGYTELQYYKAGNVSVVNQGQLYSLGNGFTARFTGLYRNMTFSDVSYGLWFANASNEEYYLCLVACRNNTIPFDPIPAQIMWFFNTNGVKHNPVTTGATLQFQMDGNLVLRNADTTKVFETGTAGRGAQWFAIGYKPNIVLMKDDGTIVWKSFQYPTDTIMSLQAFQPGMKLASWASSTNISSGPYSMVMENGGIVLYVGHTPYWVFSNKDQKLESAKGSNNTQFFAVICGDNGEQTILYLSSNFSKIDYWNEVDCDFANEQAKKLYFGPTILQSYTVTSFLRIEVDGNLAAYYWKDDVSQWSRFYSVFSNLCDLPDSCGPYGICSDSQECTCPSSFLPKDPANLTLGCKPSGNNSVEFEELKAVTYFSNRYSTPNYASTNASQCKNFCNKNASCTAAFFNSTDFTCYLVQEVRTLQSVGDQYVFAFLKINSTQTPPISSIRKKNSSIIVGSIIGSLGAFVLAIILLFIFKRMYKKSNSTRKGEAEEGHDFDVWPRVYSFAELTKITTGFSQVIGVGGFATVYKGTLSDGDEVAVKLLKASSHKAEEFAAEISILGKLHHLNLVELLGYCFEESHRILVYPYMVNGSLSDWIFGNVSSPLSWDVRFDIINGVTQAMAYLHEGCKRKILHLDLKPQNILLDAKFCPKVADFGFSKFMDRDQSNAMTNTMRGTPGYLAPDWLAGMVTEKTDVYSYGMVLFEILSGQKNKDLSVSFMNDAIDDQSEELISSTLVNMAIQTSAHAKQAKRVLKIALLCVQQDQMARPSMTQILQMLQGVIPIPDLSSDERRMLKHTFKIRASDRSSGSYYGSSSSSGKMQGR